jgi:DNA polymerase III subunit delta'
MSFKPLAASQPAAAAVLQRSLASHRLAHAYLFAGDALEDMELAARELAKAVNCESPTQQGGCDQCDACRKIDAATPPGGQHPDVQWIRPESKSRVIVIEQTRELEKSLQLKPTMGRMKVGIIVEADRIHPNAANSFLKTLEEPPDRSLLLLLTAAPGQLLETVRSRCQRLQFGAAAARQPDAAHAPLVDGLLALLGGGGSVLKAYKLFDTIRAFLDAEKKQVGEQVEQAAQLDRYRQVADAKWLEKKEEEMEAQVEAEYRRRRKAAMITLEWLLRDVLIGMEAGDSAALFNRDRSDALRKLAASQTRARALANLETIETLQDQLERNVNEALALEVALLRLSGLTAPAA